MDGLAGRSSRPNLAKCKLRRTAGGAVHASSLVVQEYGLSRRQGPAAPATTAQALGDDSAASSWEAWARGAMTASVAMASPSGSGRSAAVQPSEPRLTIDDGTREKISEREVSHAAWQRQLLLKQLHGEPKPAINNPYDKDTLRLWESKLLSRACVSLAFHVSSHFHVPTEQSDPLASALAPPSGGSSTSSALTFLSLPLIPPPLRLGLGLGTDEGDPHGLYDNLPAVYGLKAVAAALVDPQLWKASPGAIAAASAAESDTVASSSGVTSRARMSPAAAAAAATLAAAGRGSALGSGAAGPSASNGGLPIEAPPAVTAVAQIAAASMLRLATACGHAGCYSLSGYSRAPTMPPELAAAVAASAATTAAAGRSGSAAAAAASAAATAAAWSFRLPGVPFSGRQLARLYDMAAASSSLDPKSLSSLPSATAAALLLLLAATQPTVHPAVRRSGAAHAAAASPAVAAALLARYLRVGSRSHSPLDTVRVMWSLLRLQLPCAGRLQLPVMPGDDAASAWGGSGIGPGSESGPDSDLDSILEAAGPSTSAQASSRVGPKPGSGKGAGPTGRSGAKGFGGGRRAPADPMTQLGRILKRQLKHRDRVVAALTAVPAGELYGTWQLAFQLLALSKERLLAAEQSAAALDKIDSALDVLESTLGSLSPAKAGAESAEAPGRAKEAAEPGALREAAAAAAAGEADGGGSQALTNPVVEALEAFLALAHEVATNRHAAPASSRDGSDSDGSGVPAWGMGADADMPPPPSAWASVPSSDAEWRRVLGDTEQRLGLLLNTWPELSRLVSHERPSAAAATAAAAAAAAPAGSGSDASGGAAGAAEASSTSGSGGGASGPLGGRAGPRVRLHLEVYSELHFRTLERLYRAVKAQAPDARLLARLAAPVQEPQPGAQPEGGSGAVEASGSTDAGSGGGGGGGGAQAAQLLGAVALPHRAAVDMVFTDSRGRRVGLSLAHLGASRRAPGELAVMNTALVGWPEAGVAAAQQGFRAARATARARAAARNAEAAEAARAAATIAAAAMGLLQSLAAVASSTVGSGSFDEAMARDASLAAAAGAAMADGNGNGNGAAHGASGSNGSNGSSSAAALSRQVVLPQAAAAAAASAASAAAARIMAANGSGGGGGAADAADVAANSSDEERDWSEEAARALETDVDAVLAAPSITAAAAEEAAAAAAKCAPRRSPPVPGSDLDLDELLVLELDHDWFHLRESYLSACSREGKWTEVVRDAIGSALSYTDLPWEAQVDLVWYAASQAGVDLPIRVYA